MVHNTFEYSVLVYDADFFVFFNSNKECPTCRKKLVSKRSLRPDPNFDALISKYKMNSTTKARNMLKCSIH